MHYFSLRFVKLISNGPITLSRTSVPLIITYCWLVLRKCLWDLIFRGKNITCLIRIKIPVPYNIFVDHNVIAKWSCAFRPLELNRKKANLMTFASLLSQQEATVLIDNCLSQSVFAIPFKQKLKNKTAILNHSIHHFDFNLLFGTKNSIVLKEKHQIGRIL